MDIALINITPSLLATLYTAARTCTSNNCPNDIWMQVEGILYGPDHREMIDLLKKIWSQGHMSVFEHSQLTYTVSGISRTCLAQYSRHRIGVSLSVRGQRKDIKKYDYITPDTVKVSNFDNEYHDYITNAYTLYEKMICDGIPSEDARFILPEGTAVNMVTTVNLRSLRDLWEKRGKEKHAQWEIADLVNKMVDLAVDREPWLKEFFVQEEGA